MTMTVEVEWSTLEKCAVCFAPTGEVCRSLKNGQPVSKPHKGRRHIVTVDLSAHKLDIVREKLITVWTWKSVCSCGKFISDNYGDPATARRAHERHVRDVNA